MTNIVKFFKQRPVIIVAILCLLFLMTVWTIRLIDTHKNGFYTSPAENGSYHSDDVAQQNILWAWQNGYDKGAIVGSDNWFLKYPIYIATNNLGISPSKRLFLNSWIVLLITAIITISAFLLLSIMVHKKRKLIILSLLSATLLLSFISQEAFGVIKMPNSRNIELSIFLILLVVYYGLEIKNHYILKYKKGIIVASVIATGLLIADDPIFIYFGILPLLIIFSIYYFIGKIDFIKYKLYMAFLVIVIFIAYSLKLILTSLLPLSFYEHTSSIVSFENFTKSWAGLIGKGINIFGIKIFDYKVVDASIIYSIIVVVIVAITTYLLHKRATVYKNEKLFILTILTIYLTTLTLYLASNLSIDGAVASRYLIILVYLIPFLSIIAIGGVTIKRQAVIYISLIACLSIAVTIQIASSFIDKKIGTNAISYEIIINAQKRGYSKGLGRYWNANITTYLSNHSQTVFPVLCKNGKVMITDILFEKGLLDINANNSYYIWDSLNPETRDCIPSMLGTPVYLVELATAPGVYMSFYNKDITKDLELGQYGK